jgi:hypothetical protein
MADPFDEILWKIRWADQHCQTLQRKTNEFFGSNFYRTSHQTDRQNRLIQVVTEVNPIPPELSLLIGDVAHNLHTALDHLIWLFARPTPKQERSVQFPIVYAREHFAAEAGRRMPGVSTRVRALVKRLQPYHRRTWPETALLGHIKEIDNWDKHRALTTAAAYVEHMAVSVTVTGSARLVSQKTLRGRLKPGAVLSRLQMSTAGEGDHVRVETKVAPVPVFDDCMPKEIRGLPFFDILSQAGVFIRDKVVPMFRPFLK